MITTEYIHKFIDHNIMKYIPKGIDPVLHINSRKVIKQYIMVMLKNDKIPLKLSYIKLIITDYKKILYKKYSLLN